LGYVALRVLFESGGGAGHAVLVVMRSLYADLVGFQLSMVSVGDIAIAAALDPREAAN
jgi:hypothetical protein